jgi:hypothetical protein
VHLSVRKRANHWRILLHAITTHLDYGAGPAATHMPARKKEKRRHRKVGDTSTLLALSRSPALATELCKEISICHFTWNKSKEKGKIG